MTISKLIKELQKLETKYGKRLPVCVDRRGVKNANPDYSHVNVTTVDVETIAWAKEDSFTLANGSERIKTVVTLCGE